MELINYHSRKEISQSQLKFLLESEKAFIENLNNPKPPAKDMEFGTMVHKYLLEYDTFDKEYCVIPSKPENAKGNAKRDSPEYLAYKEWIDLYGSLLTSRKLVEFNEFQILKLMKSNFEEKLNEEKLTLGKSELKLFWSEMIDFDVIECRGMLDNLAINDKGEYVAIDVKTTQSLKTNSLYYSFKDYRYDIQEAFYRRGLENNGIDIVGFKFFCIEKKAPYDCRVVTLSPDTIYHANNTINDLLTTYINIDNEVPKGYESLELNF